MKKYRFLWFILLLAVLVLITVIGFLLLIYFDESRSQNEEAYSNQETSDFKSVTGDSESMEEGTAQENPGITYDDILNEYKKVAESNFDSNLLEQAQYVNEGVWNFSGMEQYSVYYRISDIAGDGIPELLISINEKEAPINIVDIYGMEDEVPVRITDNDSSVGYRSQYYICVDNRIKCVRTGGALDSQIDYYSLSANSVFLNLEEQYIYNGWDGELYTHVDSNNVSSEISKEEYLYCSSGKDVDFESEWELLYEGDFIHYVE